jgi:hypothetical protein
MIIILSFSVTASLSSVMICCTTVAIYNISLLVELGACNYRLFSEFPVVVDAVAWGEAQVFSTCLRCTWSLVLRLASWLSSYSLGSNIIENTALPSIGSLVWWRNNMFTVPLPSYEWHLFLDYFTLSKCMLEAYNWDIKQYISSNTDLAREPG